MDKDQTVRLMTDYINEMNRNMAYTSGMPIQQIEEFISSSTPELLRVNGLLYDLLVEHGLIR
jgi:hypothetical protein